MTIPIRATTILFFVGLFLLFIVREQATAQDPFGEDTGDAEVVEEMEVSAPNAGSLDKTKASTGSDSLVLGETNAVVRSLRTSPPRSYADLAKAVQLMSRIRRWDEVQFWLDKIISLGINEASATEMLDSVGSHVFLGLLRPEVDITAKQRESIRGMLELASASSRDPKKLGMAIQALRSNVKSTRIQGYRDLKHGGNRGVAALLESLLSEQSDAPNSTMSEAFMLMGEPAFAAWKAAMASPDAAARGRLVQLAAGVGESSLMLELCAAAHDAELSSQVRSLLTEVASSHGNTIPSAERVYRHAIDAMKKSLSDFQRFRWSDEADSYFAWQLSSDNKVLLEVPARNADLFWQQAVNHARSGLRAGQSIDLFSAEAVAVLLEDASRDASDAWTTEMVLKSIPTETLDSDAFACLIWDSAVEEKLSAAQLLAVQNLSRWVSKEGVPGPVLERLVNACSSGFASVRYQAAASLVQTLYGADQEGALKLQDKSFGGRSKLEQLLREMRQLDAKPLVLLVGGSSSLRTQVSTLLQQFSYRVFETSSASQAMAAIRQGLPIESVFIVDRVFEMRLGEMVQRIRANPTTSTCPIAILADSLSDGDHRILSEDNRVVVGSVPPESSGLSDILRRMAIVNQAPRVESVGRLAWKQLADAYWVDFKTLQVSKTPESKFIPWAETPVAQKHLVTIVLDKSLPLPEREHASQIFVQSVKQFGLQLSSETENAQYDEYNLRGPNETDLRVLLGRVLDAIEAAKGKRTWAEVAP
jgi:CheY-like chemotaxis protein